MTDQQYYDNYSKLVFHLAECHELDRFLFSAIFEGKIKPMIKNTFSSYSDRFSAIDIEDVYQDIFIKLWTRCVSAYFMNEKYETDAAWFLGWCKIVVKNHITSLLRRPSLRTNETIDDPDRPLVLSAPGDASADVANREAVAAVFRAVAALPSKIEMKLVWYEIYLLVYSGEAKDRIEANRVFIERRSNITFGELMAHVLSGLYDASSAMGEDCGAEALGALGEGFDAMNEKIGDALGNDPVGKISDWIYKINKKLKETLPTEVMEWDT